MKLFDIKFVNLILNAVLTAEFTKFVDKMSAVV